MVQSPPPRLPVHALAELGLTEDLVIGEAVVLELRPASFATRALALLLDLVVMWFAFFALAMLLAFAATTLDDAAGAALSISLVVLLLLGVPVTVETLTRGRSIGKLAAGLRVVRDDGGPIRFRQALVRALLMVFEGYLLGGTLALVMSLIDSRGRRVGDLLAGTYVIRERTPSASGPPLIMPPWLAGWAHGADIGRIPDPLALAIRQFLRRTGRLHPGSRQRLGLELSAALAPYVSPPPPTGVHPEAFMTAVLVTRRDRDLARLRAEEARRQARDQRRGAAGVLAAGGTRLVDQQH